MNCIYLPCLRFLRIRGRRRAARAAAEVDEPRQRRLEQAFAGEGGFEPPLQQNLANERQSPRVGHPAAQLGNNHGEPCAS
jgi:hypothetical protein